MSVNVLKGLLADFCDKKHGKALQMAEFVL